MKSTREKVLQTIKSFPKSTVKQIADHVSINAISVRHHLTKLQMEGLVAAEEERHGVGRPRLVYSLTPMGLEYFPTRYFNLAKNILDGIKDALTEKEVHQIFQKMANKVSAEYKPQIKKYSIEERLDLLIELMEKEGFNLIWEKKQNSFVIKEISCPFHQLGEVHPEICIFDKTIIANILNIPMDQIQRTKAENDLCVYSFSK